jgi:heptosyltransferase-2
MIDVLVIPQTGDLLNNNPKINEVILFDKRKNKIKAFISTLRIFWKKKYNLTISPHSSVTTGLLIYLAGIPIRVGFSRWAAQYLLTHKLQHLKNTLKIKKNLHLLSIFAEEEFSVQTELYPTEYMYERANSYLEEIVAKTKKIIAVAPGSNWFTKRWPIEHYDELVTKLIEHGYGVVFIGSEAERSICNAILPEKNFVNLAGKLTLLESAAVIDKCDLMICNDSGAMHLANAMKTDVFVFFGPTVQKIGYFPIGKNDIVFETDLDCRPCSSHGTKECPLGHFDCMRSIKPDTIMIELNKKLADQ